MDMKNMSTCSEKDGALPDIARCVRILLVDHNTTTLMFLASQFEQQQYKVTTTESASIALSLFEARKSYYDIVIADFHMQEMDIYEFVQKVHHQRMTTPIILIAENPTTDLAREAIDNGVCYIFSKPPSHRDIVNTWQHIVRVTGELPALTDTTKDIDREKYGNPSAGSSRGAARNRNPRDVKRKMINTDEENNTGEDDGRNPKKSRMTWTSSLHEKFLQAINSLGEQKAGVLPSSILGMMKEPGLTHHQVASHWQKYKNRTRPRVNPQEAAVPIMPPVLPSVPMSIFKQEQASDTANTNYTATRGSLQIPRSPSLQNAPKFVGYSLDDVIQKLDTLNYTGNNNMKAINNNEGLQVGEGNGGVQIAQVTDQYHETIKKVNTNIGEQARLPQSFGNVTMEGEHEIEASSHMSKGLRASNVEPAGVQVAEGNGGVQIAQGIDQNHNNENANANIGEQAPLVPQSFGHRIQESGHLTNGLQDPNHELAGESETGMYGFGNAGNLANMNNANSGEGTSTANQQFPGMPSNEDIGKMIQELEASGLDLWDLINKT